MIRSDAPLYPFCVELSAHIKEGNGSFAQHLWQKYCEDRAKQKQPVKLWEQAAVQDTVRELVKSAR